jgi:hypothetical protein
MERRPAGESQTNEMTECSLDKVLQSRKAFKGPKNKTMMSPAINIARGNTIWSVSFTTKLFSQSNLTSLRHCLEKTSTIMNAFVETFQDSKKGENKNKKSWF